MSERLYNLERQKPDLSFMAGRWQSPILARSAVKDFTGGLYSSRTMANLDAIGEGPENRIKIGRKVAYRVEDFIRWMEKRSEVVE